MSEEKIFNSLEDFTRCLKEKNIQKIAFSEVNERRAEQTEDNLLEVIVIRKADLLTYKDSVIYKYSVKSDDLDSLYSSLIEKGFEVKRINKNIT